MVGFPLPMKICCICSSFKPQQPVCFPAQQHCGAGARGATFSRPIGILACLFEILDWRQPCGTKTLRYCGHALIWETLACIPADPELAEGWRAKTYLQWFGYKVIFVIPILFLLRSNPFESFQMTHVRGFVSISVICVLYFYFRNSEILSCNG